MKCRFLVITDIWWDQLCVNFPFCVTHLAVHLTCSHQQGAPSHDWENLLKTSPLVSINATALITNHEMTGSLGMTSSFKPFFFRLEELPKVLCHFSGLKKSWVGNHRMGIVWNTCYQYTPAVCSQHCQTWMECEIKQLPKGRPLVYPKLLFVVRESIAGVLLGVVHLSHLFQLWVLLAKLVIWTLCKDSCLREEVSVYNFDFFPLYFQAYGKDVE